MVLWDLSTRQKFHTLIAKHDLYQASSDLINMVSPDANEHNFILWTPFSKEERTQLHSIEKELDIAQVQFLHQLYMAKLNNTYIPLHNNKQFESLPKNVQSMVMMYLQPKEAAKPPSQSRWWNWTNLWKE